MRQESVAQIPLLNKLPELIVMLQTDIAWLLTVSKVGSLECYSYRQALACSQLANLLAVSLSADSPTTPVTSLRLQDSSNTFFTKTHR